jgi:hypothetical protein
MLVIVKLKRTKHFYYLVILIFFLFGSLVQRKDADVVIHGDIWANNYLFNRSDDSDCFMVDWQFTSTGNIVKK